MNLRNILLIAFFIIVIVDRIIATPFLKRKGSSKSKRWLTYIPILTYSGIIIFALSGYFLANAEINLLISSAGIIIFMFAFFLRNSAIKAFGGNWDIYTEADSISHIVKKGPYQYMRHPYYAAVLLELIGFSLVANTYYALILILLIQLPLLLIRIYFEEKSLIKKFNGEYVEYMTPKGSLLPIRLKLKDGINAPII